MPENAPPPDESKPIASVRSSIKLLLLFLAPLAVVLASRVAWITYDIRSQPPFLMEIEPTETGSRVRFIHQGKRQQTDWIRLDVIVDEPISMPLVGDLVSIPGGTVEFHDVTSMPGRFTLQFGERTVDVMVRGVDVGETTYDWKPSPTRRAD